MFNYNGTDLNRRADLNKFAEDFQELSNEALAARFIRLDPNQRAAYLSMVRGAARDDSISWRKRAVLNGAERRLENLHNRMLAAKR